MNFIVCLILNLFWTTQRELSFFGNFNTKLIHEAPQNRQPQPSAIGGHNGTQTFGNRFPWANTSSRKVRQILVCHRSVYLSQYLSHFPWWVGYGTTFDATIWMQTKRCVEGLGDTPHIPLRTWSSTWLLFRRLAFVATPLGPIKSLPIRIFVSKITYKNQIAPSLSMILYNFCLCLSNE